MYSCFRKGEREEVGMNEVERGFGVGRGRKFIVVLMGIGLFVFCSR